MKSAVGKIDRPAESQSISNVCLEGVCVCCSEETTALSCPAPSVLQDALHQQDSGGISYIRPSKLTFKEHGRRMTLQRCLFKVWKSSEHLGLCVWQCQSTGAPHLCF